MPYVFAYILFIIVMDIGIDKQIFYNIKKNDEAIPILK